MSYQPSWAQRDFALRQLQQQQQYAAFSRQQVSRPIPGPVGYRPQARPFPPAGYPATQRPPSAGVGWAGPNGPARPARQTRATRQFPPSSSGNPRLGLHGYADAPGWDFQGAGANPGLTGYPSAPAARPPRQRPMMGSPPHPLDAPRRPPPPAEEVSVFAAGLPDRGWGENPEAAAPPFVRNAPEQTGRRRRVRVNEASPAPRTVRAAAPAPAVSDLIDLRTEPAPVALGQAGSFSAPVDPVGGRAAPPAGQRTEQPQRGFYQPALRTNNPGLLASALGGVWQVAGCEVTLFVPFRIRAAEGQVAQAGAPDTLALFLDMPPAVRPPWPPAPRALCCFFGGLSLAGGLGYRAVKTELALTDEPANDANARVRILLPAREIGQAAEPVLGYLRVSYVRFL